MPRPNLIVFDLDGTLVDTAPDLAATMNVLLENHGRPRLALDSVRLMVGRGARVLMQRAMAATGDPVDDAALNRLVEEFVAIYEGKIADESRPYDGVVAAIEEFRRNGHRLAVCTNKPEGLSNLLLRQLGLRDAFSALLGGDSLPVRKPDPLHLTATIDAAGGRLDDAVLVGDSRTDLDTARAAGVPFIGVSFGYTETPMAELGPDILIDSFAELPAALEAVCAPAS